MRLSSRGYTPFRRSLSQLPRPHPCPPSLRFLLACIVVCLSPVAGSWLLVVLVGVMCDIDEAAARVCACGSVESAFCEFCECDQGKKSKVACFLSLSLSVIIRFW